MATDSDVTKGTQFPEIWQSSKSRNGFYSNPSAMHILPRKQQVRRYFHTLHWLVCELTRQKA